MTAIEQLAHGLLAFVVITRMWYGLAEFKRRRKTNRRI